MSINPLTVDGLLKLVADFEAKYPEPMVGLEDLQWAEARIKAIGIPNPSPEMIARTAFLLKSSRSPDFWALPPLEVPEPTTRWVYWNDRMLPAYPTTLPNVFAAEEPRR